MRLTPARPFGYGSEMRRALLGLAWAVPTLSCSLLVPLDEYGSAASGAETTGTSSTGAGGDVGCPDGVLGDAKNCGACGHDCLASSCEQGECVARTVVELSDIGFLLDVVPGDDHFYVGLSSFGQGGGPGPAHFVGRVAEAEPTWILDTTWYATPESPPWSLYRLGPRVFGADMLGVYVLRTDGAGPFLDLTPNLLSGSTGASGPYHLDASALTLFRSVQAADAIDAFFLNGGVADGPLPSPETESVWNVVAYGSRVYWSARHAAGGVYRDGPVTIQSGGVPANLRQAAGFLHWARCDAGEVWRLNLEDLSAEPQLVADGRPEPFFLAADNAYVYWIELLQPLCEAELLDIGLAMLEAPTGRLMRAPADGSGAPLTLKSGISAPTALALHGGYAYYVSQVADPVTLALTSRLNRVPK